jgi:hypothetical protein
MAAGEQRDEKPNAGQEVAGSQDSIPKRLQQITHALGVSGQLPKAPNPSYPLNPSYPTPHHAFIEARALTTHNCLGDAQLQPMD